MIGVSKTFGGSSILSSPALASAEKLGKSSLSAFFVLRNLRKRPPKDHYILERKSIFNIFFWALCDYGIMNQAKRGLRLSARRSVKRSPILGDKEQLELYNLLKDKKHGNETC